jgi:hypothetical protein
LPWGLHPFWGSLQQKFHLCPTRQPTPCLMISVSWTYLDVGNHCVSIALIALWSQDDTNEMDPSLIHSYKTVHKSHRIQPKSVQNLMPRCISTAPKATDYGLDEGNEFSFST